MAVVYTGAEWMYDEIRVEADPADGHSKFVLLLINVNLV